MFVVKLRGGGYIYLEKDSKDQYLTHYNDGSWAVSSEAEISMWESILRYEHIIP